MRHFRALLCSAVFLLAGCTQQLYENLTEHEANEVVAALMVEGVRAAKKRASDGQWAIRVPEAEFSRAVVILRNQNLPAQTFDGLGQVFRKDSLVSTPTEERARLMYAISQELQRTISQIDGVVIARVHPVVSTQSPYGTQRTEASASVFIKHRASVDMASRVGQIRRLVVDGIEGLSEDRVSVVLFPAELRVTPPPQERDERTLHLMLLAVAAVLALLFLVTFVVFAWLDYFRGLARRLRTRLKGNAGDADESSGEVGVLDGQGGSGAGRP